MHNTVTVIILLLPSSIFGFMLLGTLTRRWCKVPARSR
jgi:hypothetical protein